MALKLLWTDGSPADDVRLSVRTLFETPVGTVPLDRDFGVDTTIVDLPYDQAAARLHSEYAKKLIKYEPRARVRRVTVSADAKGKVITEVVIGSA